MGLFDSAFETLGLVSDYDPAIQQAEFNPYNVNMSVGSLSYEPDSRTFSSQLAPEFQSLINQWLPQLSQIDPNQQLGLMRQQAAPFEEQQRLNLENRLFKQGILQHSAVDAPGGARRSLFEAQAGADVQRQMLAQQLATQQRQALLNQILGVQGLEGGLFSAGMGYGQLGQQSQLAQSQLMANQASQIPNLTGNLLTGALTGWAMGGF
jgi:hypothetical protein